MTSAESSSNFPGRHNRIRRPGSGSWGIDVLRLALIALAVTLSTSPLLAQGRGRSMGAGRPFHAPGAGLGAGSRRTRIVAGRFGHRRFGNFYSPYFYGAPYWADYWPYDEPYDYGPEYPPAEAPAAPPEPAPVAKNEPLPDPVLLELQGGHWVRVKNFTESAENASNASPSQAAAAEQMPPAVLVYRDGHREEVTSYSIIGEVLYTRADYWTTGAWSRTIQLADLDLPATLEANHDRSVKFDLPSGPDEVVIRP